MTAEFDPTEILRFVTSFKNIFSTWTLTFHLFLLPHYILKNTLTPSRVYLKKEIVWQLKLDSEGNSQLGLSVCRSFSFSRSRSQRAKTKKALPWLSSSLSSSEDGLELRGRVSLSLAEKPCRSFSFGQLRRRRQLHEHESPGETALLTGYLLGSREGGMNSPLNLTSHPLAPSSTLPRDPGR